MHAANSIDSIASYFVRNIRKNVPAAQALRALITANPTVFPTFTTVLFNILVFGECKNQWRLARPLLSLLLAGELQRKDVRIWAAHARSRVALLATWHLLTLRCPASVCPVLCSFQGELHLVAAGRVQAAA